jgi:hypothetical protein
MNDDPAISLTDKYVLSQAGLPSERISSGQVNETVTQQETMM